MTDPAVPKDPLFAQILRRRTNRSVCDPDRPVPADAWRAMRASLKPDAPRFGFVGPDEPNALEWRRDIAAEAWRIELTTPRTIMESYHVLRVGAAELEQHRDGLFVLDRLPVLMSQLGLFDRSKPPGPNDYATTSQIRDFTAKLESTPVFLWIVTDGNDRVAQVDAGRAYVRLQLAPTAVGDARCSHCSRPCRSIRSRPSRMRISDACWAPLCLSIRCRCGRVRDSHLPSARRCAEGGRATGAGVSGSRSERSVLRRAICQGPRQCSRAHRRSGA